MSAPNTPDSLSSSASLLSDNSNGEGSSLHDNSPPSSPGGNREVSPPTSPVAVHSVVVSPDTPDLMELRSATSSSSSDGARPQKRRRKDNVSLSTLRRRLYGTEEKLDESAGCSNTEQCNIDQEVSHSDIITDLANAAQDTSSSDSESSSSNAASGETSSDEESVAGGSNEDEARLSDDSDIIDCASRSVLQSEASVNWLYQGSNVTADEGILRILKLYVKEKWTKTSLDNNVKLIKGLLPQPNNLPTSGFMLLNRLNEVAPFQTDIKHYYCSNSDCQLPFPEDSDTCSCGCKDRDVFYEYPLEPQIKYFFEHRNLASLIDRHKNRVRKDGCISDIQDGTEFIKVKSELTGNYDITLLVNADGVSLVKSSKEEVWSILSEICEVPPSLRSSFMILSGVYVSKNKPRMNTFFKPFVGSLKKIENSGGVNWIHPQSKEPFSTKIACPLLSADAPAKAYILNVKLHSHRYGCNVCEQKARKVALTPAEVALNQQLPARKRKKAVRRFIFEEPAPLRNGARMHLQGLLAEERHKSRKGVVGETVACDLPYFDRALCICAEYLHVVCLGVVKYFLNLMFFVKGPWYIGDKVDQIDHFLASIKVPDFIKRLPRGMSDLKFLIGSELRALLLFYSLPAFQEHLPSEYFQHWILLVGSIFILLQDFITEDDLKAADIMLRLFVREIHVLYGDKFYTYNVHNLLHLCLLVRRWGNLHVTSAFDFEKFNSFIISHVHGTKHMGQELLNNIKIIQSVQVFEGFVSAAKILACNFLPDFETCGRPISSEELSIAEKRALSMGNIRVFKLFGRIKVKSQTYTSKHYDGNKKRANSYVQLKTDEGSTEYGHILYFVEDLEKGTVVCLVDMFKEIHSKIIFHEETRVKINHLVPVEYLGKIIVISLDSIMTKVIMAGDYLCLRPNSHEVNL